MPRLLFALLLMSALSGAPAWAQRGGLAWQALSAEQQQALEPLTSLWPKLSDGQQRQWIALAHNYNRMTPEEQATLQSRMSEWASLTPAQRAQARLNFGQTRSVPADEKRAKWEEYQALPVEERERLAKDQPKPPVSAAPALRPKPVPPLGVPAPAAQPERAKGAQPSGPALNRHTLLPKAPTPPASATR